jgi:hypothetical protein
MELEVNCYSGRKADERPVRFRLDKRGYTVEEVLDQWYGPDDAFYLGLPSVMNVGGATTTCLSSRESRAINASKCPALFQVQCKTPRQIELANAFCRYLE